MSDFESLTVLVTIHLINLYMELLQLHCLFFNNMLDPFDLQPRFLLEFISFLAEINPIRKLGHMCGG